MSFHFDVDTAGSPPGPVTVQLDGRLTLGPQLLAFGRKVTELLANRPRGVLLDLTAVDEIDSAGLGELVLLYTQASERGCPLCLVRPPARIARLLETTKLSGILPHFDDVAAAQAWVASASREATG